MQEDQYPRSYPSRDEVCEHRGISEHLRRLPHLAAESISARCCLIDARIRTVLAEPESGMATAEYAVVLIAATGFAGLLVAILKSGDVRALLMSIVKQALNIG